MPDHQKARTQGLSSSWDWADLYARGVCVEEENTGSREFWFLKHSFLFSWMGISILFHISLWIENFFSLKKDLRNRTVFDVNKLYEHKT